jgi:AcrR family transcriptional regulator
MPRRYSMDTRRARAEETRRRIVEATAELHARKGIFGTSWKEIAERADVSVATVYNHFPTLDELVPACGEWIAMQSDPPSRDDAVRIFAGAETLESRIHRLVEELFAFYRRAEPYLELDPREREIASVREWEEETRAMRDAFVRIALESVAPDDATVRAAAALLDFPVYKSFRRHEVPHREAAGTTKRLLLSLARDSGSA